MVRVVSLASFPRHLMDREFYAFVPKQETVEEAREKDRLRQQENRARQRRRTGKRTILVEAPEAVLAALKRNEK